MLECFSIEIPEEDGNVAISYYDAGSSDSVLICLHGIQGSKYSFEPLISSVVADRARIIAPDLPGFGDSGIPKNGGYSLDEHAERLVAFFEMLELEQVSVLGHSLGGMLGTLLLQLVPDRISRFINLEGNLRGSDCGETRRVASMPFETFKTQHLPQLRDTPDPFLRAGLAKVQPDAFYETAISIVEWSKSERLMDTLAETQVPVLFAKAANGNFVSEPKGRALKHFLVPDTDHFSMGRSPVLFDAVKKFLMEANELSNAGSSR